LLLTTATFLLLLDHLTFVFLGACLTRSLTVLPTRIVALVRLSFGLLFADTVMEDGIPVPTMAATSSQARTRHKDLFFFIPAPQYPFFLFYLYTMAIFFTHTSP
jgi:hypothetical protein